MGRPLEASARIKQPCTSTQSQRYKSHPPGIVQEVGLLILLQFSSLKGCPGHKQPGDGRNWRSRHATL
ncbi:hypothetical protein BHE74_00031565 [Ensete ventricosum]|nr:hypothetical protein BHE74_00031565 [Ensete ventricosum]